MNVFISRNRDRAEALASALENRGAVVNCTALITIVSLEFNPPENKFDWIFFSSRNCVKHFFASNPNIRSAKLAAIGPMTAKALEAHGAVKFVGVNNETGQVGSQFASIIGSDKVLFPISKSSLRTVQSELNEAQVSDLVCYETVFQSKKIPISDVYLFTSPSNVRSYAKVNSFPIEGLYLAGPTTCKTLREYGIGNPITLPNWQESTIIDAIFSKQDS